MKATELPAYCAVFHFIHDECLHHFSPPLCRPDCLASGVRSCYVGRRRSDVEVLVSECNGANLVLVRLPLAVSLEEAVNSHVLTICGKRNQCGLSAAVPPHAVVSRQIVHHMVIVFFREGFPLIDLTFRQVPPGIVAGAKMQAYGTGDLLLMLLGPLLVFFDDPVRNDIVTFIREGNAGLRIPKEGRRLCERHQNFTQVDWFMTL